MKVTAKINGNDELERKLLAMEPKVSKGIVRKAVRKAQNLTKAAMKQNANSMVGGEMGSNIAGAIKLKAAKKKRKEKGTFGIDVIIDPNKSELFVHRTDISQRYYIPAAIEYGHRLPGGSGKAVAAIPFMRIAASQTEKARVATLLNAIKQGIKNV